MARMPSFDDIDTSEEETIPTVSVPKGWAVEADDYEEEIPGPVITDTDEEPVIGQKMPSFGDEDDTDVPDDTDIADIDDDDGQEIEAVQPVIARPKSKRNWVEDWDKDDVPPVVSKPRKKTPWAIEDYDDDEPVKPKAQPVPVTDDDEVTPIVTKRMPVFGDTDQSPVEKLRPTPKPAPRPKLSVTRLSERAMLVSLNISQWSGRRFDRKVSDEINQRKAASASAGRYNKVLLPECEELAEIHRQTSSLRNWFVDQTLPWMNDGARIMPSSKYMAFNAEFRQKVVAHTAAVDKFIAAYPSLKAKAPSQLPGMYDPDDYPHLSELPAKFSVAVRVLPLPDKADFRLDLDDKVMAEIAANMADHESDLATIVAADCVLRLSKVVSAMATRLADSEAVFRDSLVENIVEAVEVIRDLNITDDPEVEALRAETETRLAGFTAEDLRNDMSKRRTAAKAAADIAAKMSALMGV